ncbi:MAG TPA: hypothetical protein VFK10_18510 [Burkholderiaceae bacterium]|nr:hypothetical protein [Burkholderiaceae bacterium]
MRWLQRAGVAACAWLFVHAAAPAADSAPWQLVKEDAATDTRVWLRERVGEASEFRATTRLAAHLGALAAVLLDDKHTQDWVYRARESVVLESDGPTRGVTMVVTDMPWPLQDRESIVAWELKQDPRTLAVTLVGRSVPERLPPNPERVRMPRFESRWELTPQPGGQVDVVFEGHGNPGGNLALPLLRDFINQAMWQGPWRTINALRDMVRRPEFKDATLPFIQEPAR